jgi:hypothetical protein
MHHLHLQSSLIARVTPPVLFPTFRLLAIRFEMRSIELGVFPGVSANGGFSAFFNGIPTPLRAPVTAWSLDPGPPASSWAFGRRSATGGDRIRPGRVPPNGVERDEGTPGPWTLEPSLSPVARPDEIGTSSGICATGARRGDAGVLYGVLPLA